MWVATSTLVPGEVLTADAVELPLAALPSTAATGDPTGTMVLQHIGRGEVITSADVGSVDDLLPPGWRGVAIAADDRTLRVSVGDRVDVIAMGRPIAMDGVVIEASPTVVVIGVPGDVAADVATAAHDLLVVLVRR